MTNLTNFNRDMSWLFPDQSQQPWAGITGWVSLDGNVYDKHAYLTCANSPVNDSGTLMVGVALTPPDEEPVPFRVKADASVYNPTGQVGALTMGFGYLENNIISGDNDIGGTHFFGFPADSLYDDVWCIAPSMTHAGKTLVIFLGIIGASNDTVSAKLTVQRLIGKPDNYATANQ